MKLVELLNRIGNQEFIQLLKKPVNIGCSRGFIVEKHKGKLDLNSDYIVIILKVE